MSNLAYDNVMQNPSTLYKYRVGKGAVDLLKQKENAIHDNKIKIVHTIPKMSDTEREKNKKMIAKELYEIFSRIQSQLKLDNEITKI